MKASDFSENEAVLIRETKAYNVALDGEPVYAALVGSIISMFALIEDYVPKLLTLLTGLSDQDSRAIVGTFRSFSNRLDLLKAIYKPRGDRSVDATVGQHYVGLLTDANRIRNKYAHATYGTTGKSIRIKTFSSDYARDTEIFDQKADDFENDIKRLRRITAELHGLIYRDEIPLQLHKQLQKLDL